MTDKPILMSPAMALAAWHGNKTQTRRVIHKRNALDAIAVFGASFLKLAGCVDMLPVRARVGDLLWVREPWRVTDRFDGYSPSVLTTFDVNSYSVHYIADDPKHGSGKYRQARHMPRVFSRTTLKVTAVRVELLRDINEDDAIAEGCSYRDRGPQHCPWGFGNSKYYEAPILAFAALWDSLNAKRGYGWDTNPWVAAYTFEVIKRNIDEVKS